MRISTTAAAGALLAVLGGLSPVHASADQEPPTPEAPSGQDGSGGVHLRWGGHLKQEATTCWPEKLTLWRQAAEPDSGYDGRLELAQSLEMRQKLELFLGDWLRAEVHYELGFSSGDNEESLQTLQAAFPGLLPGRAFFPSHPSDERRLLNLTGVLDDAGDFLLYHRLDRLSLSFRPRWFLVRLGRQAVTWGNGILFNPMDLCHPFLPLDFGREYKVGDDMLFAQVPIPGVGNVQGVYVPRRDPSTGRVEWWRESSLAGRLHVGLGMTEADVVAARHCQDQILGLGVTGYLGDAAWRADGTWTFAEGTSLADGYLSAVANIDHAWVWWDRNFHALLELFYNGLGSSNYTEALEDPRMQRSLARGRLFTLGRTYLAGQLRVEPHPLVQVLLTSVFNMADFSGLFESNLVWDAIENLKLSIGASIYHGREGTEFGGFEVAGTGFFRRAQNSAFARLSYYF